MISLRLSVYAVLAALIHVDSEIAYNSVQAHVVDVCLHFTTYKHGSKQTTV